MSMTNRIKFLAEEQSKYEKKIALRVNENQRHRQIRAGMLEEAKLQVTAEKARERELRNLSNSVR